MTKNRRLTFRIAWARGEIGDLDFEDSHWETAMGTMQDLRIKNPAHPGRFVKREIVEAVGLLVTGAAAVLGVTHSSLSALLNERVSLSPEMTPRIENVICISIVTRLRMQTSYDIARTRERGGKIDFVPFERRIA
ncbi:MAG: HigA family addiction module antitoxin [Paracoccaceae bacterium]|nr:HigA family addiction module antitoxin [Paracoccaceae bacterium]